jgi:hypothetical protein
MGEGPQEPLEEKLPVAPIWAVSANIVEERPYGPAGHETRRGTGKFNANQKVYLCDVFWGPGGETSTVIGRYRGKYKFITLSMQTRFLTHFRAELVYSPTIIRLIYGGWDPKTMTPEVIEIYWLPLDGSEVSHEHAQSAAETMNKTADHYRAERLKKIEEQQ